MPVIQKLKVKMHGVSDSFNFAIDIVRLLVTGVRQALNHLGSMASGNPCGQ